MAPRSCLASGALQCQPGFRLRSSLVSEARGWERTVWVHFMPGIGGAEHVPSFLKRLWIPSGELNTFLLDPVRSPLLLIVEKIIQEHQTAAFQYEHRFTHFPCLTRRARQGPTYSISSNYTFIIRPMSTSHPTSSFASPLYFQTWLLGIYIRK